MNLLSRTAQINLGGPGSGPRPGDGSKTEEATDKARKYSKIANEGSVPAQHETAAIQSKIAANAHVIAANKADEEGDHTKAQGLRIAGATHGENANYHQRLANLPVNHNLDSSTMRGYMTGYRYKQV